MDIMGTSKKDHLVGTLNAEAIYGLSDQDLLEGDEGNDTLDGGAENDTLIGGNGNNWLDGGSGDDSIQSGDGNNTVSGGSGADWIMTGNGNDSINGGSNDDTIEAGDGDNTVDGGSGDDMIDVGAGNNTVDAGSGRDRVTYVLSDTHQSSLNGASGEDALVIQLTQDQAEQYADELEALEDHIASGSNDPFETSFGLTIQNFESVELEYTDGEPENDPPVAADDTNTLTEDDTSVAGNVLTNDTDPDGDPITVSNAGVIAGTYGELTLNEDGSYEYVANGNQELGEGETLNDTFNINIEDDDGGTDSSELEITLTGINDGPVGSDDTNTLTEDDASVAGNVLTNDTDAEGDPLNVSNAGVIAGTYGALTLNADGTYEYVANGNQELGEGETLTDSFNIDLEDDDGGSDSSALEITITGINDAPDVVDDSNTLTEDDTIVTGNVLTNDTDAENDPLNVANAGVIAGAYGELTLNADGTYEYVANDNQDLAEGETLTDTFNIDVEDDDGGSVSSALEITITGLNDDPDAVNDTVSLTEDETSATGNVLTNDSDPEGDTLNVTNAGVIAGTYGELTLNADGTYEYVPDASSFGELDSDDTLVESFNISIDDSGTGSASSTLEVTIQGLNDAPVTVADTNTLTEDDASVVGNVITNDSDPDMEAVSVAGGNDTLTGTYGELVLNADGTYEYSIDPAAYQAMAEGETNIDVFSFDISDGDASTAGSLEITITGVNDDPEAVDDTVLAVSEEGVQTAKLGNVLNNDLDPDQDPSTLDVLSFNNISGDTFGSLTLNANGSYQYNIDVVPDDGETVVAEYEYVIEDDFGGTDTGILRFEITGSSVSAGLI